MRCLPIDAPIEHQVNPRAQLSRAWVQKCKRLRSAGATISGGG
jgi:hypothetical protein